MTQDREHHTMAGDKPGAAEPACCEVGAPTAAPAGTLAAPTGESEASGPMRNDVDDSHVATSLAEGVGEHPTLANEVQPPSPRALAILPSTHVTSHAPFVGVVHDSDSLEARVAAAPPAPVIGRRRNRRRNVEARATERIGRQRVLHATTLVHAVAARLRAGGLLSDAALLSLRALLKRGARRQPVSAAAFDDVEREFRARATELAAQLPDPELALREAHRLADARCEEVDRRKTAQSGRRKSRGHMRVVRAQMRAEGQVVLAALTNEQVDVLEKRQRVLHAMARGASWSVACVEAGVTASKAAVYRWRKAFEQSGVEGLVDRRVLNGRAGVSLEIRTLARAAWRQCPNGKSGSVYAVLKEKCAAAGVVVPSYGWLADFIRYEIPADEKIVRDDGMVEWRRQAAPRHTVVRADVANELWQCDDTPLDIWVRAPNRDGSWEVEQPYATAIIDIHSRACMAVGVWTRTPNAWSVALTLRKAILPKASRFAPFRGVPQRFAMDNGKNYRSEAVSRTLALLNTRAEYCAPRSPNQKPEVERLLRTLQENLLPRFPGYKKAHMVSREAAAKQVLSLLTIQQLREQIDRWVEEYNDSHHEGISKSFDFTPRELWEHTVVLREVEPALLNRLLLQSGERVVGAKGVKMTLRGAEPAEFWSPALVEKSGLTVLLLFNPEDLASVHVADAATGLFICEAYRMGIDGARYGQHDIVQAQQGRAAQLAGVADRLHAYHEEAERGDRLSPERTKELRAFLEEEHRLDAEELLTALPPHSPRLALTAGDPLVDAPNADPTSAAAPRDDDAPDDVVATKARPVARARPAKRAASVAPAPEVGEEADMLAQLIRLQGGR